MTDLPRVALFGCGSIASAVHLRILDRARCAELVAVADPDPAGRERAERFAPAVADAGELLGRADVDAVVICAPSAVHAELAVAAAKAGKHLYVEKPLATTLADGERVRDAVRDAGVIAAVGFNRRRHPLFRAARAAVQARLVGDVLAVETIFAEPAAAGGPAWRRDDEAGGGPVADLGSHHFDLARWLLGAEIESVEARGGSATVFVRTSMSSGVEVESVFSREAARAARTRRGSARAGRVRRYRVAAPPGRAARGRSIVRAVEAVVAAERGIAAAR